MLRATLPVIVAVAVAACQPSGEAPDPAEQFDTAVSAMTTVREWMADSR